MTPRGFEETEKTPENTDLSSPSGAESGALSNIDPELAKIIAAWPSLPAVFQKAIVAIAESFN